MLLHVQIMSILLALSVITIIGQRLNTGSRRPYSRYCSPSNFSYEDSQSWPRIFPGCGGTRQSPINIDKSNVQEIRYNYQLKLKDYSKRITRVTIENNGHTIEVKPINEKIIISGGPANRDSYELEQFHFHFGKKRGYEGSEHAINSIRSAMEIHFVHRNTKYSTMSQARNNPDGILVIAIICQLEKNIREDYRLFLITDNLSRLQRPSKIEVRTSINLSSFFPTYKTGFSYWTYKGSLTTPMCNQAVTWVVGTYAISINNQQLKRFRTLLDHCDKPIAGNVRPLQPLNGRKIGYVRA